MLNEFCQLFWCPVWFFCVKKVVEEAVYSEQAEAGTLTYNVTARLLRPLTEPAEVVKCIWVI